MTDKMEQEVGSGAVAIQSNRDTNIGYTPAQVIDAIAKQLPAFGEIAKQIVEARVADFKSEVLDRLAANEARIDAFSDPAFVNTLNTAEKSYAFTDEKSVQTVLVDLISKRSLEEKRSRKSLTFDQAVEVAGSLTPSDFSALTLCFIFRYTAYGAVNGLDAFATYLNTNINPFIADISREQSAYQYLEAQRCATISMGSSTFETLMRSNYGGVLSKGMRRARIAEILPSWSSHPELFLPCFHASDSIQLAALDRRVWDHKAKVLSKEIADQLWAVFEESFMNKEEILAAFSGRVPHLREFAELWEETALSHLQLTTLGMCIGYTNATRTVGFDADLDIWIK